MTFPIVVDADTKNGTVTSNSASWTLTYPTNLASGDLILAFVACDGTPVGTWPANWLGVGQSSGTAARLLLAKKISLGTETGTFTLGLSASEQGAWRVFRITGWEGTIGTAFGNDANSGAAERTTTSGADANPNPPVLDPNNWATEDTLWFAACAVDTSRTISVYPLASRNTADVSGGAGGATLGVCTAESAVSSLDPGTFTISASDDWAVATVAIRPGTGSQTLTMPTIASGAALSVPTVVPGAVSLLMAAIAAGSTLFAPAVVQTVAPPTIASSAVLFEPTLTVGAITISPPAIASGETLFTPTVVPGAVTITVPAIASTETLFAPALGYVVAPPAIASGETLFAPTIVPGAVSLSPPAIASGETLFAPTVSQGGGSQTLDPPSIASGGTLFFPTVVPGAVTLTAPAIASSESLFTPALSYVVALPTLASGAVLNVPTITTGAVTVAPPAIASGATVFAPTVANAGGTLRSLFDDGTIRPMWCYHTPDETPANWAAPATEVWGILAITPTGQVYVWASSVWAKVGTQT